MSASALDFDGVIFNSIDECFRTSFAALRKVAPYADFRSPMRDEWRELFYLNRGVVRPARDYFKLWKWILDSREDHDANLLALSHISSTNKELSEFETAFFAERASKINNNPSNFVKENPIYDGIAEVWSQIPRPLYIVTTKDDFSTKFLLEHHGLEIDGLFTKEDGSKPDALRKIARTCNLTIEKVRFVDDNPEHIQDGQAAGATSRLVGWGYGPYLDSALEIIRSPEELIIFLSHEEK